MAKSTGQKLKLLYILKILSENTDEDHPISMKQLLEELEAVGIQVERKTVYTDIEDLKHFGYDILRNSSKTEGGYYLASREFELPELKLLVDAVQASKFITVKKTKELIGKLEKLAGKHEANRLQRQVYVVNRVKTSNESIYYNVDNIHRVIQDNVQITFQYLDWTLDKKLMPRKNGTQYQVSPWALIWQDENYYLAAYDSIDGVMKHYRVDKMGSVEVLKQKREGLDKFAKLELTDYTNQTFGMFSGAEETVTLCFPNRLVGVVLDRFGREVDIRPTGEESFLARVKVAVSGQFFGWLAGIGPEAEITAPERTREQYKEWLAKILERY